MPLCSLGERIDHLIHFEVHFGDSTTTRKTRKNDHIEEMKKHLIARVLSLKVAMHQLTIMNVLTNLTQLRTIELGPLYAHQAVYPMPTAPL